MIKLYTNKELLILENRKAVHPLLFDLHYYENAHPSVKQNYVLVDIPEHADVFIFPLEYFAALHKGYGKQLATLYQMALTHKKKLMIYTGGDYGKTFKDSNVITWRNAGFKFLNESQTNVIPAFISDPLQRKNLEFKLLPYNPSPEVSFTGFANSSFKEGLRITLSTLKANFYRILGKDKSDMQSIYNAAGNRFKYLKSLENHSQIKSDFIYRDKYRAGAITEKQREKSTIEFFENLNNSPYTFCLRGAGNFSVRFYEALACGRIPVLIDTDVELPLQEVIKWDEHICRVLPNENVSKKLIEFHKSHTTNSFNALQKSNRNLYENYLVRHAFFCKLQETLKTLL